MSQLSHHQSINPVLSTQSPRGVEMPRDWLTDLLNAAIAVSATEKHLLPEIAHLNLGSELLDLRRDQPVLDVGSLEFGEPCEQHAETIVTRVSDRYK